MQRKISGAYEYQAFLLLQIAFTVVYILRGLDKIIYTLTDWAPLRPPLAFQFPATESKPFILAIGIVEVLIGIGVIFKPKFFAYFIAIWSLAVVINFALGQYYDFALREFGLLLAALALGRHSHKYGQ